MVEPLLACENPSRSGGVASNPDSRLEIAWYIRLLIELMTSSMRDYSLSLAVQFFCLGTRVGAQINHERMSE